jgi:hypothetical protein
VFTRFVTITHCRRLLFLAGLFSCPIPATWADSGQKIEQQLDAINTAGDAALQANRSMQGGNLYGPHMRMFFVESIDDSPGLPHTFDYIFPLSPGNHFITVGAAARDGRFGGSETRAGSGYLSIDAEKGKRYRLVGDFERTSAHVWIEDVSSGKSVTARVHITMARYTTFTVPLLIFRR